MEEWQGCLSPSCQLALINARQSVENRGGCAITVEDFLLALLETEPRLLTVLKAHGVDHDELTRTIQCEQPIITVLAADGGLSSQLMYWWAVARERVETSWMDWPLLLEVLVRGADRLQGKAYVAVLEQVVRWELESGSEPTRSPSQSGSSSMPIVITDSDWLAVAEDMAVAMMVSPNAVYWMCGHRGSGKTAWLQSLLPLLQHGYVCVDLRRECEIMASDAAVMPVDSSHGPVLVLDNVSPKELLMFMDQDGHMAQQLVHGFPGPVLLLSAPQEEQGMAVGELEGLLGRPIERYWLPMVSSSQLLAVATSHQPRIEKHWQVELTPGAIKCAARAMTGNLATPGHVVTLLECAAARVALFAERGPLESQRIAGELDSLQRQVLVALARQRDTGELEQSLQQLSLERAASEVGWYERKTAGNLRRVMVEDVLKELDRGSSCRPPIQFPVQVNPGRRSGTVELAET